jgi:hypothetical protein
MKKTVVEVLDDLDGQPAADAEAVNFTFGGIEYEIDLRPANVEQFAEALAPYIAVSRRVGGTRVRVRRAAGEKPGGSTASAIREWARQQGYEVSDRGRINTDVAEAYAKAQSTLGVPA